MTVITATQQVNPPLPLRKDAILNHLAHHATNGPAYVQLGATKALARLTGLYAEARYEAQLAFETARDAVRDAAHEATDQATEKVLTGYERITELKNGADPTEEELGGFAKFVKQREEAEEEEEGSGNDEDEPP
ncbi:MAG: hypothetical protein OXN86_11470 [Chloroflexota bacterium]|nr:hypothetical protein [Chloroflexota bacterium]